jgi:hypothetical protein
MNTSIVLNKLGNHWYPAVNHNDVQELVLDPKFEKYLSLIDTNKTGCLIINFSQCHEFIENALFFKDEDINRYFITNDSFDLTCFILNHQFKISSKLYCLLEREYDFSFHQFIYKINISKYEI